MSESVHKISTLELPETPKILMELRDARGELNAVGQLVDKHKDLAKEVLSTINAPYFSLVREIKNTEEAVRMLGMNRVINLTTSRLLRSSIFAGKDPLLTNLWNTSIRVAVISVLISKELNIGATDEAYTLGVFHNVGMAILNNHNTDYKTVIKKAYFHESGQISQYEIEASQMSHADIGAQVAQNWGLDPAIVKAIKLHHSPELCIKQIEKADECGELLLILKIAEQISKLPGYLAKSVENHEWEQIKEPIFDHLKLTEGMFLRFEHTIKKQLSEIKS